MENYFHYIFKISIKKIGKDRLESVKFRCLLTKRFLFLRSTNLLKLRITIILAKSKSIFGVWSSCSSWLYGSWKLDYQCGWWCFLQVQSLIRYFDFIHHRHAATTDGWKARYRDQDGFSAGNSSSFPQVAPLQSMGDFRISFNGDRLG